ncbi:MAG: hypothetical protein E7Z74_09125 [Methanobrevibacter millerae]|uniref:Uncharacterized protein n=1 Tax=Methanobrevibacter millerae TaxID=230361 RepID=A0A8T3VLA7_9EURY|nr:hypothetical protein [Methanobrevibacter millerae]
MNRCVWIILNRNFEMMLDGEVSDNRVVDKKFSPGSDIWTNELPKLRINDENVQKEYDSFIEDILTFFLEPQADEVLINAKIGEESEYLEKIIIRKIEEYEVEEIIG